MIIPQGGCVDEAAAAGDLLAFPSEGSLSSSADLVRLATLVSSENTKVAHVSWSVACSEVTPPSSP